MTRLTVTLWPELRRAFVPYPIPADAFDNRCPMMRAIYAVCGKDAVAAGDIGEHLRGLAICARGASDEWRIELGLRVTP